MEKESLRNANEMVIESVKLVVEVEDELRSLLPTFLKKRREELAHLKTLVSVEDFNEIQKVGHDLRGVPGAFGYHYLVEIGALIEEAARRGQLSLLTRMVLQYEFFMDFHSIRFEGDERTYHERDFTN